MWALPENYDDRPLWQGRLTAATQSGIRSLFEARDAAHVSADEIQQEVDDLPEVTIGIPNVWDVRRIAPSDQLRPREPADYYLVRLACSIRPRRTKQSIEWAEFKVSLSPDGSGLQPLALDLHPSKETQTVRRRVALSLAPDVKFQEVAAVKLGGVESSFEYDEIAPVITTYGVQSPEAVWEYAAAPGVQLQGDKKMNLLVQAPSGCSGCVAAIDLTADVSMPRLPVLPARLFPKRASVDAEKLDFTLW